MMKSTFILLPIFFFFALSLANAQQGIPERMGDRSQRAPSLKALEKKAESSYKEGNYAAAMQYYEHILKATDSTNISAWLGYAEAAVAYTQYEKANQAYDFLSDSTSVEKDGAYQLRHADIKYLLGKYDDARKLYEQVDSTSTSADQKAAAKIGINNCDWAVKVYDNKLLDIQFDSLKKRDSLKKYVNTGASEYSNVWYDKHRRLYYSAYNQPYKGDSTRSIFQLMTAQDGGGGTLDLQISPLSEPNRHTAYVSFSKANNSVYYAVGKYSRDKPICFDLYRRKQLGDGTWGDSEKLPDHINLRKSNTTQPFICTLPGESVETLFFVSDRPGGKGEMDIWYCKVENDTFSQPENLVELNTEKDDISPFFHATTSTLFFSSAGRQSLGGFDIYQSERKNNLWGAPQHLPVPLNSPANDIFYSKSEDEHVTFLSTNRFGTEQFSPDDCCYDVWRYCKSQETPVTVCNLETGDSLSNTTMQLFDLSGDEPQLVRTVDVPGATQSFRLQPGGVQYRLVTSKSGFYPSTLEFSSPRTTCDTILLATCLRPAKVDLIVTIVDGDSLKAINGATLVHNTSGQLLPDGTMRANAGGPLASITKNAPDSNTYHFNLLFDHTYSQKASKAGYTSDSSEVSTLHLDHDTTFHRQLRLRQGLDLDVYVYNEADDTPLNDVVITLMELNKNQQWVNATGPNSNHWDTLIFYDTRYKVIAEKKGYYPDELEFGTGPEAVERKPFQHIRKDLYLRTIEDNLPLTLFFHNDEPGPHTSKDLVAFGRNSEGKIDKLQYQDTYFGFINAERDGAGNKKRDIDKGYIERKQEYIDIFTAGMTGAELALQTSRLDSFFKDSVRGEWNRLRGVTEKIYKKLKSDSTITITITIKGYASPLGNPKYNDKLTSRRASTVERHFRLFTGTEGGELLPFIRSRENPKGRLILVQEPHGSRDAPDSVSGSRKDRRLSVYSIEAALERRVEIIGIETDQHGNETPLTIPVLQEK